MDITQFTFVDLFSGIGGFKLALEKHGGVSVGFSEINKNAISVYCNNFKESQENNFGDITKIKELPPHDLLTAGVPCQSWSIAGNKLGFNDDRGQLWNDTIHLLDKSKPKAFIFENVKGLADPRNKKALEYILDSINAAGYYANAYLINSKDYGVTQNRVRLFIVGFKDKQYFDKFNEPQPLNIQKNISNVLDIETTQIDNTKPTCFQFNDIRNGTTTIHSWDILDTTERQKHICLLLLSNRRKKVYGVLDGNPLSLYHLTELDSTIQKYELNELVSLGILKTVEYSFEIQHSNNSLTDAERILIENTNTHIFNIGALKNNKVLKIKKIPIVKTIDSLLSKGHIVCCDVRYEFKNTKISTGLFGVNRIYLPSSCVFSTLVASDTNDYVSLDDIPHSNNMVDYKNNFIKKIYETGKYRKITKAEACRMQGFPQAFVLPDNRARWMKLLGNSVSVPVVSMICKSITSTGVFTAK